ncbi:MAG: MFS transporter [Xanthomonadales bacterium]|nr:MFS transporter [Xanthomonadales bacterium]MCB1640941.1 MFS transporter [Xanthomonadales bacterium]
MTTLVTSKPLTPTQRALAVVLIVAATFLLSVSVGMNAVVFPTALESYGASNTVVGIVMAIEFISVFAISFGLSRILRFMSLRTGLALSALFRMPPLILLAYFTDISPWLLLVFVHGVGNFLNQILLQTWINSLPFRRSRGFAMALFGTSISLGLACGPVLLQFIDQLEPFVARLVPTIDATIAQYIGLQRPEAVSALTQTKLLVSALITTLAAVPTLLGGFLIPRFRPSSSSSIVESVRLAPAIMFAVAVSGVSILGVQSFITLYGIKNQLSIGDASLLLTAFMLGSILLEIPIAWISDFFDRRYVMMLLVLLSLVCAAYLPIAIYTPLIAWGLLFLWGGVIGGLFSVCLAMTADRFTGSRLVGANAAFSIMDNIGGMIGILLIGISMDLFGSDGLPYVIMFAGVVYFSFALTRYQVR